MDVLCINIYFTPYILIHYILQCYLGQSTHIFLRLSSDSVCILFVIYFYKWICVSYSENSARVKSLNSRTIKKNKDILCIPIPYRIIYREGLRKRVIVWLIVEWAVPLTTVYIHSILQLNSVTNSVAYGYDFFFFFLVIGCSS